MMELLLTDPGLKYLRNLNQDVKQENLPNINVFKNSKKQAIINNEIHSSNKNKNHVKALRFMNENDELYPDWEEKKLGEIMASGGSGGTPTSTNKKYYNGQYPFLAVSDITKQGKYLKSTEKSLTDLGIKNSGAWVVPANSLIYTLYASVGKMCINKQPITTSQALYAMKFNDTELLEYMYYAITKFNKKKINKFITIGTQANINANSLKSFEIPLPSLSEQEKISNFLSKIDERIEQQTTLVELLKKQKQGYSQKLFNGSLRFKNDDGTDYSDWEVKKLGEIAQWHNGYAFKPKDLSNSGTVVVKIKEMLDQTDLQVKTKLTNIPKNLVLKNGDIIFSWSMTIDVKKWQSGHAYLNQHLYKVEPNKQFLNKDFSLYLIEDRLNDLSSLAHGGTAKHITRPALLKFKVNIPSHPEQEKIANFLSALDNNIQAQEDLLNNLKLEKQAYIQKVLG